MGKFAYENDLIACNNLPSRRWKIRRIRTARDKKLRHLDKECRRIRRQIWDLGYEELIPPVQRGYKRLFVLNEETQYSERAGFYQGILDKINTVWFSSDKIFKTKKRRIRKWDYRNRKEQKLREPDKYYFNKEEMFTEEEKKYFYPVEYYCYPSKCWNIKYLFIEPWRFRLRIMPNMITRVQRKDPELERYRDELSDFLDRKENYRRLTKMRGGNGYAWKKVINELNDKEKYAYNSLRNMPLHQIMENYKEECLEQLF